MEKQKIIDTRNFPENEMRKENQRYDMEQRRKSMEEQTHNINAIRQAVKYCTNRFTRRFFVYATLYMSFRQPVTTIDDFYELLKQQVEDYFGYLEWKPFIFYALSKLMCDVHQIRDHTEMRKFRATLKSEIQLDIPYHMAFSRYVYDYSSPIPMDDDGHFQYTNIFFESIPCVEGESQVPTWEFEAVSVLNRRISYERHLKHFGLIDNRNCIGYPMPICIEFTKEQDKNERDNI